MAAITATGKHSSEAVPGEQSQFDVVADGRLLFSKEREGRFPDEDEIVAQLG